MVDNSTTTKEYKNSNSDTLNVHYTYWWPSGGPFVGPCGDRYSLVFTGTIIKIDKPSRPYTLAGDKTMVLYTPQKVIIKINDIKVKNPPNEGYKKYPGKNYNSEQYFKSDCFYGLNLKEGDKVIVFIYSYEGEYGIPSQSILKVESFNVPIIASIEKYIQSGQDPLVIEGDTVIWSKYNLDYALKQIIDCKVYSETEK